MRSDLRIPLNPWIDNHILATITISQNPSMATCAIELNFDNDNKINLENSIFYKATVVLFYPTALLRIKNLLCRGK